MSRPTMAVVQTRPARIHAVDWGVAFGLLDGLTLFMATAVLVIRDGPEMGQPLEGCAADRQIGTVYNAAATQG